MNGGQFANLTSLAGLPGLPGFVSYPPGATPPARTVEAWIKTTSTAIQDAFGYGANNSSGDRFALGVSSGSTIGVEAQTDGAYTPFTADGNWHHLAGELPSGGTTPSSIQLYLDGAAKTATPTGGSNLNAVTTSITLGAVPGATYAGLWTASVDEARISTIARSPGWIAAEYNNQKSPTTFYTFNAPTTSITVGTSPSGLSFTVDGTNYSASQTFTWAAGSSHTISTTSPQAGAAGTQDVFSNWSDSGALSHTLTVPASATAYTANFTTQYQLTTAASPAADGSVTPASGGWYNAGAVVNINATANSGFLFTNWTGSSVANANSAATTVTMSAPATVTANFLPAVSVTVTASLAGPSFTVDGTTYSAAQTFTWIVGSSHTLATTSPQAVGPGIEYYFNTWSDGGALSHTITAPSSATTYTANFQTLYQLTAVASPAADGSVLFSPPSYDGTGGGWFPAGAGGIVLNAHGNPGYSFANWTGPVNANEITSSYISDFTVPNAPTTVTANFGPTNS